MTNAEIIDLHDGLKELHNSKIPLNIKTSFLLAKNNKIIVELVNLITEKQFELYKKYGTPNDEGNIVVPNEKIPLLQQDLNELMAIDNDINITKFTLDDLGDAKIEFGIIEKLLPLIEE